MWMAFGLVFELGYLIALPAFILGFGGAYADKYFGTTPLCIVGGLALALFLSAVSVYHKVKEVLR